MTGGDGPAFVALAKCQEKLTQQGKKVAKLPLIETKSLTPLTLTLTLTLTVILEVEELTRESESLNKALHQRKTHSES